jgi:hypothetical protein
MTEPLITRGHSISHQPMLSVTSFAKNVKNATTKADPYGMTNKGTGNGKSKRNGNSRSSAFGEGGQPKGKVKK